ncbi:MAG: 4-cresol dehydrogenase (hydroxylating) flavoprotein subunit [Pseudonocardiales bacterium]|nr:4-cresol dehydrogenase (hydroxylating) flavoprotein subunit [Pseudonocardiales bacterium]
MNPARAVLGWQQAIGAGQVRTTTAELLRAGTATFATQAAVVAVLAPTSPAQVAACLRIAHAERVPIHPVSRGLNWGLGSRAPAVAGAVLDLSGLDQIVDVDEPRATVTVEPGVTFAQLDAFLTGRQSQLFLPTIGGSGQASIVGNAVERGHGIGPNPRRADAVAAIEAVLADGSEVRTGFAGATTFSGAAAHRHGVGPSLAGLFLQGRLAVVTRMTLHLERRPEALTLFGGRIGDGPALAGVLELLRPMLLDGSLGRSLFTVWNRYKYAACRQSYPWEAMRGEVPLDLAAVGTQPDWLFTGALYAPSVAHARVARHALANLTGVVASFRILEPEDPEFHRAAPKFLGTPGPDNLRSMYWRKPRGMPDSPEPERDRCGVLQLCPLLPMGGDALPAIQDIESLALAHGFEPQIGFDCTDPRTIEAFVTLSFDRDVPGEDERALTCHDAILNSLDQAGFPPYRLGVQSAGWQRKDSDRQQILIDRIRTVLDPHGVVV